MRFIDCNCSFGRPARPPFRFAPTVGELLAEWMNGETPSIDLKCLRPERFQENDPVRESCVI